MSTPAFPFEVEAAAKLNLCLYVGEPRPDGLHEICSVFEPLTLSDTLRFEVADGGEDEVLCDVVEGPNLVAEALAVARSAGYDGPALRVEVEKRIPVAAGLGGGSADAGAVLRALAEGGERLARLALAIGADVPSQLDPRPALVGGVGEVIDPIGPLAPHSFVLLPSAEGLSSGAVFAEADRLGSGRSAAELAEVRDRLRQAVVPGSSPLDWAELLVNDLQPAATGLMPRIAQRLEMLREAGAEVAMITGSGPTAFGLFAAEEEAAEAAAELAGRIDVGEPAPIACNAL